MPGQSLFLKSTENEAQDAQVERFLFSRGAGSGRLIFALDATASREPTWSLARDLTAGMIREASSAGRLSLQLVYFRGGADVAPQCHAGPWTEDPARLTTLMAKVTCETGCTQITRVLQHAQRETLAQKVGAVVFVGDACEPFNDNLDRLGVAAAALKRFGTPVFAFQEGCEPSTEEAFRKIAEWSGGAYGRFDAGAAAQLGELLRAAAAFAVGGVHALEGRKDAGARLLLGQLKGGA
jgi:hypothetical protein